VPPSSSGSSLFTVFDEYLFDVHRSVESGGWTIQYVCDVRPWAYTVGLSIVFGHPEFVIAGATATSSAGALSLLGRRVAQGERFAVDAATDFYLEGVPARLVPVHLDHWRTDRFAVWVNYVGSIGPPYPNMAALQLLWTDREGRFPDDCGCRLDPPVERLDLAPRERGTASP
jgi:hypothetical protein